MPEIFRHECTQSSSVHYMNVVQRSHDWLVRWLIICRIRRINSVSCNDVIRPTTQLVVTLYMREQDKWQCPIIECDILIFSTTPQYSALTTVLMAGPQRLHYSMPDYTTIFGDQQHVWAKMSAPMRSLYIWPVTVVDDDIPTNHSSQRGYTETKS